MSPRKRRRPPRRPGIKKHRRKLAAQHQDRIGKSMSVTQAASSATWVQLRRGMSRIMRGEDPRTGEPLPINSDGAEYLP